MSKTIAVFGAGPALGLSVARRFGREGFQVALVARNRDKLDGLVADLARENIEASAFTADLADRAQLTAAVKAITAEFGRIDVVEFGPAGTGMSVPTLDIDADNLAPQLDLLLLAPITLVRQVLPGMVERGDGALLFAQGGSAKYPAPFLANVGIAMSGLRNYVYNLNTELAGKGVYAGTLTIGALIERSEAERTLDAMAGDVPEGFLAVSDRVDPDDLAERYWDMYVRRDRVEEVIGGFGQ
jgi:short-subunit dehydrogenase